VAQGEQFDVVCSFEVVEHVADAAEFVQSCAALAKVLSHFEISSVLTHNYCRAFLGWRCCVHVHNE